jgi:hypothetical protein
MAGTMSGSTPPLLKIWESAHDPNIRCSSGPPRPALPRHVLQARARRDYVFAPSLGGHRAGSPAEWRASCANQEAQRRSSGALATAPEDGLRRQAASAGGRRALAALTDSRRGQLLGRLPNRQVRGHRVLSEAEIWLRFKAAAASGSLHDIPALGGQHRQTRLWRYNDTVPPLARRFVQTKRPENKPLPHSHRRNQQQRKDQRFSLAGIRRFPTAGWSTERTRATARRGGFLCPPQYGSWHLRATVTIAIGDASSRCGMLTAGLIAGLCRLPFSLACVVMTTGKRC